MRKNIRGTIETIVVTVLLKVYQNMTTRAQNVLTHKDLMFTVSCKCFHLAYQKVSEIQSFLHFAVQVGRF